MPKPENIFLLAGLVLTVLYTLAISPLTDYFHGPERFLHVMDYAMYATGHPGRMPVSCLDLIKHVLPEKLAVRFGGQAAAWDAELRWLPYFSGHYPVISPIHYLPQGSFTQRFSQLMDIPLRPEMTVAFTTHMNPASYSIIGYIPYIAAAVIGLWLGAPPIAILYMAVVSNALFGLFFGYLLIRFSRTMKWCFCFILLLPSVCYARANIMPDAITLELCLLMFAAAMNLRAAPHLLMLADRRKLLVLSALVGVVKVAYFFVPACLWLAPAECFGSPRAKARFVAAMVAVSLFAAASWDIYVIHRDNNIPASNIVLQQAGPREMHRILNHPVTVAGDITDFTLQWEKLRDWPHNMVFWSREQHIAPGVLTALATFSLLALVVFPYKDRGGFFLTRKEQVFCYALFFAELIVILLAISVHQHFAIGRGFQGRYLLPVFPLLLIAAYRPAAHNWRHAPKTAPVVVLAVIFVWIKLHAVMLAAG